MSLRDAPALPLPPSVPGRRANPAGGLCRAREEHRCLRGQGRRADSAAHRRHALAPPAEARFAVLDGEASDPSLYRYGPTAGIPALREAIAAHLREARMSDIDGARHLHIGAGGTHALYCAARGRRSTRSCSSHHGWCGPTAASPRARCRGSGLSGSSARRP